MPSSPSPSRLTVISALLAVAALGVAGFGLAWRNMTKTSELQLRLVRASEQNTHLKEMNLAAAGLAHETRNPLNIIRGLAQMIAKRTDALPEVREKSTDIINQTDRVTAQLNEFINYSRPREVRRAPTDLSAVVSEVVRTLAYDIDEKKIQVQTQVEPITIEASGLEARVIQHEVDHLDGVLILDRISRSQRKEAMKALREASAA